MLFHPDDNKQAIEVYFTNKKAVGNIPQLTFNGSTVNSHKHLGFILDEKLISGMIPLYHRRNYRTLVVSVIR